MRPLTSLFALLAVAGLLGACNTVEGVGKDVKSGGAAIEDTAKDVKKKL